jgi:hypothetical protein
MFEEWDKVSENKIDPLSTAASDADYIADEDWQKYFKKNSRIATRFVREDITVRIKAPFLVIFHKNICVKLMDISSKGVLISTNHKLHVNNKIRLFLMFKSGRTFVIKALVVRHSVSSADEYGIKFDRYNNELGEYLFESQENLIFK